MSEDSASHHCNEGTAVVGVRAHHGMFGCRSLLNTPVDVLPSHGLSSASNPNTTHPRRCPRRALPLPHTAAEKTAPDGQRRQDRTPGSLVDETSGMAATMAMVSTFSQPPRRQRLVRGLIPHCLEKWPRWLCKSPRWKPQMPPRSADGPTRPVMRAPMWAESAGGVVPMQPTRDIKWWW